MHALIPNDRRKNRPQMPQTMRIQTPSPRRKIQQLQTHRKNNPRNHQPRPRSPRAPWILIPAITEPTPHDILNNAHHDIRRHIIRIIPMPELQIRHMRSVQRNAQSSPSPQYRLRLPSPLIQPQDPNRRIIQPIQHTRARREIIQLLGEIEIARMKNHAKDPTRDTEVRQLHVVFAQCVGGWDVCFDLLQAVVVREEVEEGEEDGEGLLHAEDADEGPFAVELLDGEVGEDAFVRDYVLAGVVAFGWAGPEEEAVVEGWG